MATIGVLLKSWFGVLLSGILYAVYAATWQQWALYLTVISAGATLGYTVYKWVRDIIKDFNLFNSVKPPKSRQTKKTGKKSNDSSN